MSTVNSKMTAIADEIRTLKGTTAAMGLDAMASNLNEANTEVDSQADLISLIQNAIDNLPEAGSSSVSGDPDLPTGYRRVNYIKFNDAQIVDTGIICNQDTTIKCVFTREVDTAMYLYGVSSSGNTATVSAYLSSGGNWRFGNRYMSRSNITVDEMLIHTSIQSKSGILAAQGNTAYSSVSAFETVGSLLIGGGRNSDGTVGNAEYIGKIFLFEMWQGSEQVLKLIPVVSADGAYRFWDLINQAFHDSITETALEGGNL